MSSDVAQTSCPWPRSLLKPFRWSLASRLQVLGSWQSSALGLPDVCEYNTISLYMWISPDLYKITRFFEIINCFAEWNRLKLVPKATLCKNLLSKVVIILPTKFAMIYRCNNRKEYNFPNLKLIRKKQNVSRYGIRLAKPTSAWNRNYGYGNETS